MGKETENPKNATVDLDALAKRCQDGDADAFRTLFKAIQTDLHRIILSTVGPDPELEDIIQTAALELYRSIGSFKGQSRFSTWMYRLAVNVALQHLRKRRNRVIPLDIQELASVLPGNDATPEETSVNVERLRSINVILDDMSPKKRVAFLLNTVEGYSPREIAQLTDSNVLTVKSRIVFSKKEFFKKLRQRAAIESGTNRVKT